MHRATQPDDILSGIATLDTLPAGVIGPLLFDLRDFQFSAHSFFLEKTWREKAAWPIGYTPPSTPIR
jgi:hypothetical protein